METDSDATNVSIGHVQAHHGCAIHIPPQSFPNKKTVHRCFLTRCRIEELISVMTDVVKELRDKGRYDKRD